MKRTIEVQGEIFPQAGQIDLFGFTAKTYDVPVKSLEPTSAPAPAEPEGWTLIASYTRKQAIEDGEQVDVTETAKEAGIRFPVFLTRAVWTKYVEVPPKVYCQDERGRLWDVVWMLRHGIASKKSDDDKILYQLMVRNDNRHPRKVTLKAQVGPLDMDDPQPAITVMLPEED